MDFDIMRYLDDQLECYYNRINNPRKSNLTHDDVVIKTAYETGYKTALEDLKRVISK